MPGVQMGKERTVLEQCQQIWEQGLGVPLELVLWFIMLSSGHPRHSAEVAGGQGRP